MSDFEESQESSKSSESSESEGCVNCEENVGNHYKKCKDCKSKICKKCIINKDGITMNYWLEGLSNKCSKCQKLLCKECIRLCYDCANYGEAIVYCSSCAKQEKIKDIKCKHHKWYTCQKNHGDVGCGECRANRNYCGRYD
ncbi:MAG: hypothetical protein E6R13_09225 [Spirochaetes bacterium]|nr:MAG: hypothetical protein E6R13_09225 [Spirochaetota bacterium]